MEITESIIMKFFDFSCTAEEAEAVAIYFSNNSVDLEKYFEEDWIEMETGALSTEESEELLRSIQCHLDRKKNQLRWVKVAVAVAATLLLVITTKWLLTYHKQIPTYSHVLPEKANNLRWQKQMNTTGKEMKMTLEDGSLVRLMPGSVLKYYPSFKGLRTRDIYLSGEASFEVAKDKTKPFTVYAGGIATTAVGTKFTIKGGRNKITVKLYEGKVSIRELLTSVRVRKKNRFYLLPGQEFVYDQLTASFVIKAFLKDKLLPEKKYRKDVQLSPGTGKVVTLSGNWYLFNNQSLTQVFDQLEDMYNIKIVYENREMKNIYFIGKFEKTDSVESILKNIALLKKVRLERVGNTYIFKK